MAKYASFKQYEKALKKVVKDALDSQVLEMLGQQEAINIRNRTRNGLTVTENGGGEIKLQGLKDQTVKVRNSKKVRRKLSSETAPSISNYTRTGKTLDKIKVRVSKQKKLIRIGYFRGKLVDAVQANAKRGFKFLLASKKDLEQLAIMLNSALQRALNNSGL